MHFPKEFFEEEVRWDFTVSPMMKRAWAAALEVLEIVLDICDRHRLKCFASDGTLLGAVRHRGFIPWDDDIDMALTRPDYDALTRCLPDELPAGFAVAGMYTDDARLQKAAHIPNLRVIADEQYWNLATYMSRFHGFPYFRIGIDIFPLDYVAKDPDFVDLQLQICHMLMFTIHNLELYAKEGLLESQLQEIERVCEIRLERGRDIEHQLWLLYDRISGQVTPEESCGEVINLQFLTEAPRPIHGRPAELYDELALLPFEGMQMPVPKDYIRAVKCQYGENYMTPVKFSSCHDYPFYRSQEAALREMFDADGMNISIEEFCHNWQKAIGEV